MSLVESLTLVSPIDGRYERVTSPLRSYFSEYSYITYRVRVEIDYLLFFARNILKKSLSRKEIEQLQSIYREFDVREARKYKKIEDKTKHDVKAIEYYIRPKVEKINKELSAYIHFGLTSEDVNSVAGSLALKNALNDYILPALRDLLQLLTTRAYAYKSFVMIGRTHGQPAVPTTFGKEIIVFAKRLYTELVRLEQVEIEAKLTGAVGNYNALVLVYPKIDWISESDRFIHDAYDMKPNHTTTQILPFDSYIRVFQSMYLINQMLIGLCQDIWRYISDDYLVLSVEKGQVGSSTMPQKVNPIEFENAEGNLGLANALLSHFIQKLSISRLQRDLSDSTVKRSFGTAFGHALVAYTMIAKGLRKISPLKEKMTGDLSSHWEMITEGVQTILRTTGNAHAYELMKTAAQGKKMTHDTFQDMVDTLSVDEKTRKVLSTLSPLSYRGLAEELVERETNVITAYVQTRRRV